MKAGFLASLFIPPEVLLPLLTLSGLFWILGLRGIALGIIATVLLVAFAPLFDPIFDELFDAMPAWFAWLAMVGIGIAILSALVGRRFMRELSVHVIGTLLADVIRWLFVLPFRAFGALLRILRR